MRRVSAMALLWTIAACSSADRGPSVLPPTAAPVARGRSIDLGAMDRRVRPGADFFMFANGAWYERTEIAADEAQAGPWLRAQREIEVRTRALVEEAAAAPAGSPTRKLGDYTRATWTNRRSRSGESRRSQRRSSGSRRSATSASSPLLWAPRFVRTSTR